MYTILLWLWFRENLKGNQDVILNIFIIWEWVYLSSHVHIFFFFTLLEIFLDKFWTLTHADFTFTCTALLHISIIIQGWSSPLTHLSKEMVDSSSSTGLNILYNYCSHNRQKKFIQIKLCRKNWKLWLVKSAFIFSKVKAHKNPLFIEFWIELDDLKADWLLLSACSASSSPTLRGTSSSTHR